jgi:hypothetical protein
MREGTMPDTPKSGFTLTRENSKLTAWGPDLAAAAEAALMGVLRAAGAPEDVSPGGKSVTIQAQGKEPAQLIDNLMLALSEEFTSGQPLDGSITMGGLIKSDTGWNGWATAGIDPGRPSPLQPFELAKAPVVERKPGRVIFKAEVLIWDEKMLAAMEQLRSIMPPIPVVHPGGVFGPDVSDDLD